MDSDITLSPTSIACSEWSVSRDYYKRLREVSKVRYLRYDKIAHGNSTQTQEWLPLMHNVLDIMVHLE